ncbi:MAG: secretion protein HlyD [Ruminococcus sp.]|nr:secretion protein HlyD [Ruminococcus sp.]
MKKMIITLLCFAVIGGGSYFGYRKYKADKEAKIVVDVVPIELISMPSDYFDYSYTYIDGQIYASDVQRFNLDSKKLVKDVFVEEGDKVKKGDPILEYDMTVVELELEEKKNAVASAEQKKIMAERELNNIKNYKPSEDAPKVPEYEDYEPYEEGTHTPFYIEGYDPDEYLADPDEERPPQPPEKLVKDVVKPAFTPAEGNGSKEHPYIINCTEDTIVSKEFMGKLIADKKIAEICVYMSDFTYLYKWVVDPANLTDTVLDDWKASAGVTVDEEGKASIDPAVTLYGKLSFSNPTTKEEDDFQLPEIIILPAPEPEEEEDYDDGYDDYIDPDSNDYIYSKDQIKKMIAEQEALIKDMEISIKVAKNEYEAAKKKKRDGKLYAEIDGTVTKIGKPSSDDEEIDEENPEEDDPYREPSPDDNAFAVIEGAGGTEVICMVSELNLDKAEIGSTIQLQSWNSGASGTAVITRIEDEPIRYEGGQWGENPNNSTYRVHAKLDDPDAFRLYDWVEVTLDNSSELNDQNSGSVYIPMAYVRQEGGEYYIMKADKDNKLTKQYVKTGQISYLGAYIEIKGGLTKNDKLCFPYGTDVKEGVRTKETTETIDPEQYLVQNMGMG